MLAVLGARDKAGAADGVDAHAPSDRAPHAPLEAPTRGAAVMADGAVGDDAQRPQWNV